MENNPWFEIEDPQEDGEEPWDFDADELAFVAALRTRASSWSVPPSHSGVGRPEDESSLMVWVSVHDHEQGVSLGEWAVHFHGTHVRAGKVCDQLFNLDEASDDAFFHAIGTVEKLADRCADMFASVLSRAVSRTEWLHNGRVYATSWAFADTSEGLVRSVNRGLAPTPNAGWGIPRVQHARCVLVRGASEPQEGLHSPLCPYRAETSATAGRPAPPEPARRRSRTTGRLWRWGFGPQHGSRAKT
ncbi:hypothetical protein [Streptomyces wuyuanensis]|uniref:hypothetical protein n=1 Tax=Streptomyces wuyuanensis TaxID=1196353 RepID=UPI00342EFC2E